MHYSIFFFACLALEALINGQNTSRNQLCVGEELTLTCTIPGTNTFIWKAEIHAGPNLEIGVNTFANMGVETQPPLTVTAHPNISKLTDTVFSGLNGTDVTCTDANTNNLQWEFYVRIIIVVVSPALNTESRAVPFIEFGLAVLTS